MLYEPILLITGAPRVREQGNRGRSWDSSDSSMLTCCAECRAADDGAARQTECVPRINAQEPNRRTELLLRRIERGFCSSLSAPEQPQCVNNHFRLRKFEKENRDGGGKTTRVVFAKFIKKFAMNG
jgi:hypothetical protein